MRVRIVLAMLMLTGVFAYIASPFMAITQLEAAVEIGDTQALEHRINWRSLRDGLKSDIHDGIIGLAGTQLGANTLPPFGSGFMTGIADTTIDREVTPQNLVAVMRQMRPETSSASPIHSVSWAVFKSPTTFEVTIRGERDASDGQHLRLRLELIGMQWVLVRAWVPQDLVERATQRT